MKLLRNKYRWLAILVALWTRGVGFVIGAPPETVDFKTTKLYAIARSFDGRKRHIDFF